MIVSRRDNQSTLVDFPEASGEVVIAGRVPLGCGMCSGERLGSGAPATIKEDPKYLSRVREMGLTAIFESSNPFVRGTPVVVDLRHTGGELPFSNGGMPKGILTA